MFPIRLCRILYLVLFVYTLVKFWLYTLFVHSKSIEMNTKGDGIVSAEEEVQPTISEHISFAIGHLTTTICKHSYVISNIVMMVSVIQCVSRRWSTFHWWKARLILKSAQFSGLEYCVPQLVDFRVPSGCEFAVDCAKSAQEHASNQSVCGDLCGIPFDYAVFVLHEPNWRWIAVVRQYKGHQFGANRFYSLHRLSVHSPLAKDLIHNYVLVDIATNEIRGHAAASIIHISTLGSTIPCDRIRRHHWSGSEARNEEIQTHAKGRHHLQIGSNANLDLDRGFRSVLLRACRQRSHRVPHRLHGSIFDFHDNIPGIVSPHKLTFSLIYLSIILNQQYFEFNFSCHGASGRKWCTLSG